nr:MAG TPA: hypothetical protein [Caudoviricetes sp.]
MSVSSVTKSISMSSPSLTYAVRPLPLHISLSMALKLIFVI